MAFDNDDVTAPFQSAEASAIEDEIMDFFHDHTRELTQPDYQTIITGMLERLEHLLDDNNEAV